MTEETKKLQWGAHWLLPKEYAAAWGARAIADRIALRPNEDLISASHIADLLPDRQAGAGDNTAVKELLKWVNKNLLPIRMDYDGSSKDVTKLDDSKFHARWTPNGSYGYIYIVAWMD